MFEEGKGVKYVKFVCGRDIKFKRNEERLDFLYLYSLVKILFCL